MMQIVKSYGGNPRLGIWNVKTQRTDFELYPTRGIAAIIETVGSKILRAGIDQPKLIGVVRHSNTTTACSMRDCVLSLQAKHVHRVAAKHFLFILVR